MRLVDPPDDWSAEKKNRRGGAKSWQRDPERRSKQQQVHRREGKERRHAKELRHPDDWDDQQRVKPEVQKDPPTRGISDSGSPYVPAGEGRVDTRKLGLNRRDVSGSERGAVQRREMDSLR